MAWDRNDPLNILALQLDGELRAAADFCYGYNGPAQRAFARHIQGLGKSVDELTVADLKAAAAFADAELERPATERADLTQRRALQVECCPVRRHHVAWPGLAWRGRERLGLAWQGLETQRTAASTEAVVRWIPADG